MAEGIVSDVGVRPPRSSAWAFGALTVVVYAGLVACMWVPFSVFSGLYSETAFPYMSETRSAWGGFFYHADPMRIHTNTFYQVSYLLAELAGVGGSFVPYQIVYALLWWARGFLVFLLLRRFLVAQPLVAYVGGALVLVHASDSGLQWIGQLNQFGFMFWMLAACYTLVRAFQASGHDKAALLAIGAAALAYMSLWSYESPLVLLAVFPLLLSLLGRDWRRAVLVGMPWYTVVAVYTVKTMQKYVQAGGATYQEGVMRRQWSTLIGDWLFNVDASLSFWRWGADRGPAALDDLLLPCVVAVGLFFAGGVAIALWSRGPWLPIAAWCALLATGVLLVVLSFPAYLVLEHNRNLYRTQMLSGIGAGLTLTAASGLVSRMFLLRSLKIGVILTLGALVVGLGGAAAIQKGALHREFWERHRRAVSQVLRVAPSVAPNTVIVLTNVPRRDDPFGHMMWFDMAMRLAYPGIPVAGVYFYVDGQPSPGHNMSIEGARWVWDGTGHAPELREASVGNTVVVRFDPSGQSALVDAMPAFVCPAGCAGLYAPQRLITGPISGRADRRYRINLPGAGATRPRAGG